jgi:predicted membrane-bound dolichyl-phosphate-mannose-protein mannosyltransferase
VTARDDPVEALDGAEAPSFGSRFAVLAARFGQPVERLYTAAFAVLGMLGFVAAWWVLTFLQHRGVYGNLVITDTPIYKPFADAIRAGQFPYRDFALEYPPAALPVFLLPALLAPDPTLEAYTQAFQTVMLICGTLATGCVAVTIVALHWDRWRAAGGLALAAAGPLIIGPAVLSHFDLWPAALTALALALIVGGRERWGAVTIGVATMAKVYPILILPLAVALAWRRQGRREGLICAAFGVGTAAVILLPFAILAPDGVLGALERQVARPLQIESLGAAALVILNGLSGLEVTVTNSFGSQNLSGGPADGVAIVQTLVLVASVAAVWWWFARGPRTNQLFVIAAAAAVSADVAFGKVFSPQYLIWLVPLIPLVDGVRGRLVAVAFVAAGILTQAYFPGRYFDLADNLDPAVAGIVLLRDLCLVAIAAALVIPAERTSAWADRSRQVAKALVERIARVEPRTALAAVLLIALAARLIWLWLPQGSLIFDETYYVNAARVLLGWHVPAGAPYATAVAGIDPNSEHPPLAKVLIAGSMLVFGDNGIGWRIPSVVAAIAGLAAVYAIARGLGERAWVGVLAVALWSLDVLTFLHGRIGTLDMIALGFALVGAALAVHRHWLLGGIALALAALAKETAIFALVAVVAFAALELWDRRRRGEPVALRDLAPPTVLLLTAVVVGLGGLWILDLRYTTFTNPIDHIGRMLGYGIALTGGPSPSGIASNPWDWLVNGGEFDYLRIAVNDLANGQVIASHASIDFHALVNPVLLGAAALAVPFAAVLAWRRKSRLALWAIVWMAASYLPFLALTLFAHRVSYLYYFLPTIPALAIAVALLLSRAALPRVVQWAYLGATALAFLAWFPFRQLP